MARGLLRRYREWPKPLPAARMALYRTDTGCAPPYSPCQPTMFSICVYCNLMHHGGSRACSSPAAMGARDCREADEPPTTDDESPIEDDEALAERRFASFRRLRDEILEAHQRHLSGVRLEHALSALARRPPL